MSPKILYVGDSVIRLNAVKSVLEDQGYEIWTAREVSDAVRMLRALEFEAVIAEQGLMERNPEQARRLDTVHPGLPILTVSDPHQAEIEKTLASLAQLMERETTKAS
jgi:CheY-like chemotaxis protein